MEYEESGEEFLNLVETFESVSKIRDFASDIRQIHPDQQTVPIPRRSIHDAYNPLEVLSDKQFQAAYAFSKDAFLHTFGLFEHILEPKTSASTALSPLLKFSTFLFYLRSNGFYR